MRAFEIGIALALTGLCRLPAQEERPAIEDFRFEVTTIDGEELSEKDFADKVLLVDFWGTWCGPCRKAVPVLSRLYETYNERGLEILGLNYERVGRAEALRKVRAFAERVGIPYPLALGTPEIRAQVPDFRGYPTLLFFKRGLVFDHLEVGFGPGSAERIEAWIKKALAEKGAKEPKAKLRGAYRLELLDARGAKLRLGDGRYALVVLVPPAGRGPQDLRAQLDGLRRALPRRVAVHVLRRADLPGPDWARPVPPKELARLKMGRAFPAYLLVAPDGTPLHRAGGFGPAFAQALAAKLARILQAPAATPAEAAASRPGPASRPSGRRRGAGRR